MVGNNLSNEQIQTIVIKTISDVDKDGDEKLSLEEFTEVRFFLNVSNENLIMNFITQYKMFLRL